MRTTRVMREWIRMVYYGTYDRKKNTFDDTFIFSYVSYASYVWYVSYDRKARLSISPRSDHSSSPPNHSHNPEEACT
jgi:hypothetical protein